MIVALTALACNQIKLQIGITLAYFRNSFQGFRTKRCTAQVGMQNDAGGINDADQVVMVKTFDSAKKYGYRKLYLESLPELNRAINLYEKAGFKFIQGPMGNSGHFGCNIWMLKDL